MVGHNNKIFALFLPIKSEYYGSVRSPQHPELELLLYLLKFLKMS
jgi:hypothetical protein